MSIFEDFDSEFNTAELIQDLENVESGKQERKEVPHNTYEVKITKLELTKSQSGKPMVSCWFKIIAGEYKGQLIFMNQVINSGFGLHKSNIFLKSITNLPITFESFKQYGLLLIDVMEDIEEKYEYQLNYSKDAKGYNTFIIEKIFEAQPPF